MIETICPECGSEWIYHDAIAFGTRLARDGWSAMN